MKQIFTFFILFLLSALATAQVPVLVKDINPSTTSALPFYDKGIAEYNGLLFFAADDGTTGTELWATDGSEAGTLLVKDINPGATGSESQNFYEVNGYLLFTANDGTHGLELWRTDGTEVGTVLVKDINPGIEDGLFVFNDPNNDFFVWNDVLYFAADNGTTGFELWRSDGTEAGTYQVKNIYTSGGASGHSFPTHFAEYNGKLYFGARGSNGEELWVTDGTVVRLRGEVLRCGDWEVYGCGSHCGRLCSVEHLLLHLGQSG